MRVVKKETLKLISCWVERSNDANMVLENFIPPLLDAVLLDYQRCAVPAAREPEVLSTMATTVNKLKGTITPQIPKIFDAVFECTLDMINKVNKQLTRFLPSSPNDYFAFHYYRTLKNIPNTEQTFSFCYKQSIFIVLMLSFPYRRLSSSWCWTRSSGPSNTRWETSPTRGWTFCINCSRTCPTTQKLHSPSIRRIIRIFCRYVRH